ncbi:hypothetical protein ACLB2K_076832 [Fragaria x ananassa]
MGEAGLTSPLLSSDQPPPHLIVTVHDDTTTEFRNPFEFLGSGGFTVPASTTADPFKNATWAVEGVYEWVKIGVCLPIAIVWLVIFGVSLLVGFVATKLALLGWKDRQNPMPKWRCRIMWITRVCTRCILFAFGYHWIRRKGKPAPRATAPIVVSNHVSFIEPIFYFYELFPTIVASESHDSLPFVGTIIRAMQVIYVNRFAPSSRRQAVSEIKVEYLPVVFPLDNKKESAFHFAQRTSHAMAGALNVVQTSHSFGDLMLLMKAADLKSKQVRPSAYMVEMASVKSLINISSMEAVDLLDRFLSMNPDSSGHVTYHDFLRVLRLKPCTFSEESSFSRSPMAANTTNPSQNTSQFIKLSETNYLKWTRQIHSYLNGAGLWGYVDGSIPAPSLTTETTATETVPAKTIPNPEFVTTNSLAITWFLLLDQFGDVIRPAIPDLNEDEINELFNLFDADCDGRIGKDEFLTCLRRNPLLIALFSPCLLNKDFSEDGNQMLEEIV